MQYAAPYPVLPDITDAALHWIRNARRLPGAWRIGTVRQLAVSEGWARCGVDAMKGTA
jgi:hypothetical protein